MTSASTALLLDSNVLVYTVDARDEEKRRRAQALLRATVLAGRAALSVQCLTEYFRVVTERLPDALTPSEAASRVHELAAACTVYDLTTEAALETCRCAAQHSISIWDALIRAVAKVNAIPQILTEDQGHAFEIEGVRYLNPFILILMATPSVSTFNSPSIVRRVNAR